VPRVVALASRNAGKVREIRTILASAGVSVHVASADEFPGWEAPPEDAPDYLGNALLKARSLASFASVPALADDSGIEVDALGGEPGPRSARFAGPGATDEQNLEKLIAAVGHLDPALRTARYRCLAVLVRPDDDPVIAEGVCEGILITEPRGTGGFGYDPIFVPVGHAETMAELRPEEKDRISHRGKAFRGIVEAIARLADI
jgi:XTP/dITP diphosphohydrolase